MTELKNSQQYWNDRAAMWQDYAAPLIPSEPDLDFMWRHIAPGGDTLVLGVTPELCEPALEISTTVTSVDYAEKLIASSLLHREGVTYICEEWNNYFEGTEQQYDTIITDGGLLCLEFPASWDRIAEHIHDHLRPSGIFAARVYVNTLSEPKEHYENPNLNRFVSSMGNATEETDWMVHPKHEAYAEYDISYAFPSGEVIEKTFGRFAMLEKFVPSYEEGERFVSYAWQRST